MHAAAAIAASEGAAESLNRDCFCISLDTDALKHALQADPETTDLYQLILDRCPHLFANLPVFLSARHLDQMAAVIRAVEAVVRLPAYRETVLGWAPPIARFEPAGARGVFLSGIPRTQIVDPARVDRLWAERRRLFFKPAAGFGGKAVYRSDTITRRVREAILKGDYVAQALVAPGERMIQEHQAPLALNFDLRNYVYDGTVQFVAARMYRGQTTNFRTPGGGFAPVFTLRETANDRKPLG